MIETADSVLDGATKLVVDLEVHLTGTEAAVAEIERLISMLGLAAATGGESDGLDTAVGAAIDAVLAPAIDAIERGEDAVSQMFVPATLFREIDKVLVEAEDAARVDLEQSVAALLQDAEEVQEYLDAGEVELSERLAAWVQEAGDTEESMATLFDEAVADLEQQVPSADAVLEAMTEELREAMGQCLDAAEAYLSQIEAAVDQAGGALFDGVGSIVEKAGAVKEVLDLIKPVTVAFEALS
ncbi:hypothetical protein RLEG3_12330 [Rhizobium leguminosarum bv. trifolii WSM1689]|uniref:hypothetical protein n=1 Tax=Rhizobium leguminosarum TaxID=384 RepID=UPI0003E0A938|nr:hypothetical protein [Rhizobium leguminosarum]AHF86638.1 hypothetical protein RLEG3_12330 [Rhizobium leguminosarum bv. trifolii WSM1689]